MRRPLNGDGFGVGWYYDEEESVDDVGGTPRAQGRAEVASPSMPASAATSTLTPVSSSTTAATIPRSQSNPQTAPTRLNALTMTSMDGDHSHSDKSHSQTTHAQSAGTLPPTIVTSNPGCSASSHNVFGTSVMSPSSAASTASLGVQRVTLVESPTVRQRRITADSTSNAVPAMQADALLGPVIDMHIEEGRSASARGLEADVDDEGLAVTKKTAPQSHAAPANPLDLCMDKDGPCIFTSILPAWNNLNLMRLSEKIRSRLVFAHVRAASPGYQITEANCHPWAYGKFLWCHNGYIADFRKIKRRLQASLRDELFHFVQGNTDSEWAFAVFLNQLEDPLHGRHSSEDIKTALLATIAHLNEWSRAENITTVSLMNFAVSNGRTIVCSRYCNSTTVEPASLYYSSGTRFEACDGSTRYRMVWCGCNGIERFATNFAHFQIKSCKREEIVIIASEPLTYERSDWMTVPPNCLVVVTERVNLLTFPILDEYYTSRARATGGKPGEVWG